MPLLRNKNQPYFPDPDAPNNFSCAGDYCYPMQNGDIFYAQFYQTPCGANLIEDAAFENTSLGAELLTNGGFTGNANGWVAPGVLPDGNWAYGTNNVVHTPGDTQGLAQAGVSLTVGKAYRVVITLTRTAGSLTVGLGDNAADSGPIETSGTHTFDIPFLDAIDNIVVLNPSNDFAGSVDSVSVKEITYSDWDNGGVWFFNDEGGICKTVASTGTLTEDVSDYITPGKRYRLTYTVSNYASGTLTPYVATTAGTPVSANGIYQDWITPGVTGVVSFQSSANFLGCISGLELHEMVNDFSFSAITENGDGDVYDISEYVEYYEDYVTLIFDPQDFELPLGCFVVEAFDTCTVQYEEIVVNGDFDEGSTGWVTLNPGVQFDLTGGNGEFMYPLPPVFLQVLNPTLKTATPDPVRLIPGANYRVSYDIISNSDLVNNGFTLDIFGAVVADTLKSAVGSYTYDTSLPDNYPDGVHAYHIMARGGFNKAGAGVPASPQSIVVDNLSVRRIEPFTATYRSECINYQSIHNNTKLISAYCDNPAYGFEFENSGFLLQMRMVVRSFAPSYPQSANLAKYGNGNAQVTYGESEKFWQLVTDFVSESAHDAMAIMKISDHFLIGDTFDLSTEYVAEADDYQPQWVQDGSYSLAPSVTNIRIKEGGQVFNRDL